MLFRTVYGPELESIYRYVHQSNGQGVYPHKHDIISAFVPACSRGNFCSTQNVEDALIFLRSLRLLKEIEGYYAYEPMPGASFSIQVLYALRCIEHANAPEHRTDPLYMLLLTEIFIKPNRLFVQDIHTEANRLRPVQEVGGLSREKVQAWKRVMEFLGVGRRVGGGFLCVYHPELILETIVRWNNEGGNTIQAFLEEGLVSILPYATIDGDLAHAVCIPLIYLANQGKIALFPLQDSPARPYFEQHRYRGIELVEV